MTAPAPVPGPVLPQAAIAPTEIADRRAMLTGVLVLLCGASLIGFAAILVKLSDLGPQAIAFWRLALAVPALAVWLMIVRARSIQPPARPNYKALVLAGVFFAGDLAFWHTGIKITTAANATLLANLTPIIVAVAAWVLFKERITLRFALAASLALLGAGLLAAANITLAPERLLGDVLSALTAFWYAAYLLSIRSARQGASTARVMLWSTSIAAVLMLVVTLASGETLFPTTLAGWLPLLGLGLIVHVAGQGSIAFGLGRVPAALASLIILIQPVIAALAGWAIFAEVLAPVQLVGAGLILIGVYIAQRARSEPLKPGMPVKPEPATDR